MQDVLVAESELKFLVAKKLSLAGLHPDHAEIVAKVLVHADLRGVRSHGIIRTEHYVKRLGTGSINKAPNFTFSKLRPAAGLLDADDGMGHPACLEAMHKACDLAREAGIAIVGVTNTSHCGALSYFVLEAVKRGMIGMALTHTDKCVAPFGGARPFFGTNPIAYGFPTQKHEPVILDFATSNIAYGKVLHAREQNSPIPADWGVDEAGKPTTDPHAVKALLPFGGHKGYGIALVVDVLTGILLGGGFGPHITAMYGDYNKPRKLASTMMAIDPETFVGLAAFREQMDDMIDELHNQLPAPGFDSVLVPGEPEWQSERRNRLHGVPVLASLYDYLQQ
jgi:ureidoglycolate dehydrogenase (NAD+)